MTTSAKTTPPSDRGAKNPSTVPEQEHDQISQNIEAVLDFYCREREKMSYWQRALERAGDWIGRPVFLAFTLLFVFCWTLWDMTLLWMHKREFDPAPFFALQGIIGLAALLTTTVVLIKQNRQARLEEQRAHLDLKVNLLTEQKAAKLIELLEELRCDLPNVNNRHDAEAMALKQSMRPDLVLAALDERSNADAGLSPHATTPPMDATAPQHPPIDVI
jgi:uncharacterized membrane protein